MGRSLTVAHRSSRSLTVAVLIGTATVPQREAAYPAQSKTRDPNPEIVHTPLTARGADPVSSWYQASGREVGRPSRFTSTTVEFASASSCPSRASS